jgi:NAD(P)-dependent dehydrogenase (short-subunit alcohol dehydrogenase family)
MQMEIRNSIVVVTGGASGIGRALCERFAAEGAAHVVVADRDAAGAAAVAAAVGGTSRQLDVAGDDALADLIDATEREIGPIDLFCSNAGVFVAGGVDTPEATWDSVWRVNTLAHIRAARHMLPRMVARGGGYLLQTASAAGLLSQIGSASYAVTKHAALAFAEWLAITHGRDGIRVSVLCPQAVRTAMTGRGPGVAGLDGMLEPEQVAADAVAAIRAERFLVLPHPEVADYARRRADDHDRWLRGMQRLQERFSPAD